MPKPQDPRVPFEVEEYLVGRNVRAGQIGGSVGGALSGGASGYGRAAGARAARKGAARGADRGARRIRTTVEERTGNLRLTDEQVSQRVLSAAPKANPLPAEGVLRWAVPIGATGLVHVVVDIDASGGESGGQIVLRAFGKEGPITRHPTGRLADELWTALEQ